MKRLALGLGLAVIAALPLQAQAPPSSLPPPDLRSVLQRIHADYVDAFVVSEGFGKSRLTPMMRLLWRPYPIDHGELRVRDVQLVVSPSTIHQWFIHRYSRVSSMARMARNSPSSRHAG